MAIASHTITLASEIAELSRLVTAVHEFCHAASANAADSSAIQLALEEVVSNVILHGYRNEPNHSLTVTLEAAGVDRIRAVVVDSAVAFNPLARPEVNTELPLEDRPVGGLGVHLVRKLMDVCLYERRGGQNIFTIERKLSRASGAPASANIAASKFESSAVLSLTGRLDGLSSPELERQVLALLGFGVHTLVFDLEALDYVSSAGLRVFILAAKKSKAAGGDTRFVALSPSVKKIFQISGLLEALSVSPLVESAMRITLPAATRPT